MRATSPQSAIGGAGDFPLPLHKIEIAIGDKLDRATLMDGHYAGERGCYRRALLHDKIREYRRWWRANPDQRHRSNRICPGHKRAIRAFMQVIDTAFQAEVSGIFMVTSQNEDSVANQCYVGSDPQVPGGSDVEARVLFRAELEDQYTDSGRINTVAVNVTALSWPQHRVLAAKKVLAEATAPA